MKKIIALSLVLILALACLSFAGAEGVYPLNSTEEITIWGVGSYSSKYASAAEDPWFAELIKRIGANIVFVEPARGADRTQAYNLMLSGGTYTDIIMNADLVKNATARIEEKVIVPLNDYIDEYAPNLTRWMEENPEIRKTYTTENGDFICFPYLRGSETASGFWINQAWLTECGLEVPETIDEVTNVLLAFKEKYNVTPFSMMQTVMDDEGTGRYGVMGTIYDAYGVPTRYSWFRDREQKVHLSAYEEGYRNALKVFHSWFEQGLLDPDYASVDSKLIASKAAAGQIGLLQCDYQVYVKIDAALDGAENTWIPIKDPKVNKDDAHEYYTRLTTTTTFGACVTTACKNVPLACQILDYCYSDEGNVFFNYGIEDVSFNYNADGQPEYTDLYKNGPEGLGEYAAMYTPSVCGGYPAGFKSGEAGRARNSQIMRDAEDIWLEGGTEDWWLMPVLSATTEETETYTDLNSVISTYCGEMYHKFINGEVDLDAGWDEYIDTLKGMGVEDMIAIKQAQLDRFNAR